MSEKKDVCLVVPTIREKNINDFVDRWAAVNLWDHVDLMLVEDNPTKTFEVPARYHYSWLDIGLSEWGWIVPRRSDTVRSYGYYRAWDLGYKYILTLDDDCYPCGAADGIEYTGEAFVKEHIRQLESRSRWFNTLNSVKPRGIPFYNVGKLKNVAINHGLWTNVLDYDAPYQLANPIKEEFSFDNQLVPSGMYFPMCGMNVMWKAEYTVLMYHLLMGKTVADGTPDGNYDRTEEGGTELWKLQFDRFGDIWCGILAKKVLDHIGAYTSTGMPYIRHERASDPFVNLRKEANGIQVNERFWEMVDEVELPRGVTDPAACYDFLGSYVQKIGPKWFPEHASYFAKLGEAMRTWSNLFRRTS